MFPIIPYNLNQNARAVSYSEVYTNTKLPKVTASCDIPRDTVSELFDPKLIAGKLDNQNIQLDVEISDQKKLSLKSGNHFANQFHWIKAIRLADDCHGYNSRLCYERSANAYENPNLLIQITRPIRAGHELLLWFSEDILANLQMAFLTPANIQGQKKYVCHICSTTFEYPNPLKLHLTLDCDKQPISTLWDRLSKSMWSSTVETKNAFGLELKTNESSKLFKKSYSVLNLSKSEDSLKISADNLLSISPPKVSSINNTVSNIPTTNNLDLAAKSLTSGTEIQRCSSVTGTLHSSAFKPYTTSRISRNNNSIDLSQSNSNFTNLLSNCQPQAVPTIATQNYSSIVDFNHAAQMETLVSNLGKSKQGHLCIYCGKCYSRKYGLKIHIRTHTGYKPLKCKYCLRPFGDPSNLNKHVRLHAEGDTPYKCELCGKVLVRRRDLERHLRSRHTSDMQLEEKNNDAVNSSSDHSDD